MTEEEYKVLLGARILSEANDLKRTVDALASEIGMDITKLKKILSGLCTLEDAQEVIRRMSDTYPIDGSDMMIVRDDCTHRIKIMRAGDSEASSRIFSRKDKYGNRTPYYEYRDTAMSRVAPFRPEWIRELRPVSNSDPNNPDVAYNNGHGMHQMTFFIGPVNFYWEVNGKRFCREMDTGDSNYITPFWPHSFATRDTSKLALILAVTFGGEVRRAQKELYVLGEDEIQSYALNSRDTTKGTTQLIRRHMANEHLTLDSLMARLRADSPDLNIEKILSGSKEPTETELEFLAKCLNVEPTDIRMPRYDPNGEVVVKHRSDGDTYFYPTDLVRAYKISPLARTSKMPLMKGFDIEVLHNDPIIPHLLSSSLHTWLFNYGDSPAKMGWVSDDGNWEEVLKPGDSAYIQPFIPHGFSNGGEGNAKLCDIGVGGAVNLATQRELSCLSSIERVIEKKCWFD